jgi:hypothetical protein
LDLKEEYENIWKACTKSLRKYFINLSEEEDEIIWSLNPSMDYEPNFGYKALE